MQALQNNHTSAAIKMHVLQLMESATASEPIKFEVLEKKINLKNHALPITHYLDQLSAEGFITTLRRRSMDESTQWYCPPDPADGILAEASATGRQFTAAEKGLIRKVHGHMSAQQLLNILNERLACDLGPDAKQYTMEQLYAEIGDVSGGAPAGGHDWASLRKLLATAKRSGVLDTISEQVINDFAVVFSLNQKQVLVLKDIVLQTEEEQS